MEKADAIHERAAELAGSRPTGWNAVPDIGLYMDQIISYLNKQLEHITGGDEENPAVTPNMVNNYVKGGQISRPIKKKYSREQLCALYIICSIKQSLSITDSAALIKGLAPDGITEDVYADFLSKQKEALAEVAGRVGKISASNGNKKLWEEALALTLEACAARLAAEQIIGVLADGRSDAKPKKDKKEKKEKKKRKEKEK